LYKNTKQTKHMFSRGW